MSVGQVGTRATPQGTRMTWATRAARGIRWALATGCLGEIANPAGRRYAAQFNVAMMAAAVAMIGWAIVRKGEIDPPWRAILATLPVVPAAAALWSYVRLLGRLDELQRRVHLEALGIAFAGTVLGTLAYGQIEREGVVPHLNWAFVWVLMSFLWAAGQLLANRRYA